LRLVRLVCALSLLLPGGLVAAPGACAGEADDALVTGSVRPAAPGTAATATDIRIAGDSARTRIVVDLTAPVGFAAFSLADPFRVVVDVPQLSFRLPPGTGQTGRALVRAFRYGLVMPGASRLVIDLAEPARIDRIFVVDAQEGQPARLILDLARTDDDTFRRLMATENRSGGVQQKSAAPARADPGARTDRRPVIVIDPGHGGIDPGTISGGVAEKDIVFDFAQVLRERLERSARYRVLMTRTEDKFVPLDDRVAFARRADAALFISLHANALAPGEGDARGAIVFTLSETASDQDAARLAERENRSDAIAGIDLSRAPDDIADILIDLARRETMAFSNQFARGLVAELRNATRLHRSPHKSAGFRVLRAPDVPSVLVELGFVTSPADLKLMTSDAWRQRVADAIATSVDTFLGPRLATGAGR
jgi:N-acetylmuramoyl-L-alanine amidase